MSAFLSFFSLFNCTAWFGLLNRAVIRNDLIAGTIAGVLILPQAVALATLAGMPPEYGLYTSIFPVIIASWFGSSWQALSGPNTTLAIMIATALAPYASLSTPDYIMYAITLMGTLKNRYFRHPADSNPLIIQAPNLRKLYFSRCP